MKKRKIPAAVALIALAAGFAVYLPAQEGPDSSSSNSVAKPKPKTNNESAPADEAPIPSEFKRTKPEPSASPDIPSFHANATTVTVDVAVLDDKNHFIPTLNKGQFRVFEDGVPQQIVDFSKSEAPITICMLIEFSGRFQAFWSWGWAETLQASYGFLERLKPEDNVAVVEYDMHSTILSDFSPDKRKAEQALNMLRIPGMSESNLFDAVTDMADRMSGIEGRKAILLLSSGIDTFSKLTYDKARRSLQESGVPIYTISILQTARIMAESNGMMGPIGEIDFLQADNEMRTFAKETGGQSFFPRFMGEYPSVFNQILNSLRNQYTLTYHPTNVARDGTFRRIKVQLVNPEDNEPLRMVNAKGKPIKYQIVAKAGYKAPHEVD